MTDKEYNGAWDLIEPIMFEYMDMNVQLKVGAGQLTESEGMQIFQSHEALKSVILEKLGVTIAELEAETDRRIEKSCEESSSRWPNS